MNINCLTVEAPFNLFELFGFHSGRDVEKFENSKKLYSSNGLVVLPDYINSYISLDVIQTVDLDTHTMFICDVRQSSVINEVESMSYSYYLKNVKPKNDVQAKKDYVCAVCGWVYEGETLPDDSLSFMQPWR